MQSLRTELGAEILNREDKIIRMIPFRPCHSLLKQFIQLIAVQVSQSDRNIKSVDGTEYATGVGAANFRSAAGVGVTNYGMQIGSGETTVAMSDYGLETQLTTNISHLATIVAEEHPDADTWRMAITRGFLNNTGAPVAVKEVGWVSFNATKATLLDRTLYPVSFVAGETLMLTYRLTITL